MALKDIMGVRNPRFLGHSDDEAFDKGSVQKPQSRLFAVMGVPPPHHGERPAKKLTEKNHGLAWNFFAKNGVFCLKNTVFGPIFNGVLCLKNTVFGPVFNRFF